MPAKLIAFDPSLTCTGWAMFALSGQLLGMGKINPLGTEYTLDQRLADFSQKIFELLGKLNLISDDYLICEAPTTMLDPEAMLKVEQIRVSIESVGRMKGITVPGRINPRSVHYEILGLYGKQLEREVVKSLARNAAVSLFSKDFKKIGFPETDQELKKNQDIVDALLIGHLAVSKLAEAERLGVTAGKYFDNSKAKRKRWSSKDLRKLSV